MLKNEHLVAKVYLDRAENDNGLAENRLFRVCQKSEKKREVRANTSVELAELQTLLHVRLAGGRKDRVSRRRERLAVVKVSQAGERCNGV